MGKGLVEVLDDYKLYLDTNTPLALASKKKYVKIIRLFLLKYTMSFSLDMINKFISDSNSKNNCYNYKYAFQYFLKMIGKKGWYDEMVSTKKRPRKKIFKHINKDTLQQMINMIPSKFRKLAFIQVKTGCRFSEAATIRVENIDFEISPELIYIRIGVNKSQTKGGKERKIRIARKYELLLRSWCKRPYGYLFLPEQWEMFSEEQLFGPMDNLRRYYDKILQDIGNKFGIDGFSSHYLRHQFADEFLMAGGRAEDLKTLMGHKKYETTEMYISIGEDLADKALLKMEGDVVV